jgi:hypothetical protein
MVIAVTVWAGRAGRQTDADPRRCTLRRENVRESECHHHYQYREMSALSPKPHGHGNGSVTHVPSLQRYLRTRSVPAHVARCVAHTRRNVLRPSSNGAHSRNEQQAAVLPVDSGPPTDSPLNPHQEPVSTGGSRRASARRHTVCPLKAKICCGGADACKQSPGAPPR